MSGKVASGSSPPSDPQSPHATVPHITNPEKPPHATSEAPVLELDDFGLPIRPAPKRPAYDEGIEPEDTSAAEVSELPSDGSKESFHSTSSSLAKESPDAAVATKAEVPPAKEHCYVPDTSRGSVAKSLPRPSSDVQHAQLPSEWSHQHVIQASKLPEPVAEPEDDGQWQEMPAYAPYDIYNDDNKLVAREAPELEEEMFQYANLGGAAKGYTRVQLDEDAQSATSMDENTAYLFKDPGTNVADEDEGSRDVLSQMQATKDLLTEGQRIAYVSTVRLAMIQMEKTLDSLEKTRGSKKAVASALESMKMWSQKIMIRLYSHMEIESAEQIMIEQLAVHGLEPTDLTPTLMQNARVKNPIREEASSGRPSVSSPTPDDQFEGLKSPKSRSSVSVGTPRGETPPPAYDSHPEGGMPDVKTPSQLPNTQNIDIDLRWTVLCDLFLVLIADSVYDARSRTLLENVGFYLDVPWLDICRFEKRVTDALEMQEAASKENWNEDEHMETRKKMDRNRRLVMMGLATVGGGLVIGLSAGLLAPVIGAGLAAGFTTIGVAGTGSFLAGAGGAAIITTTGVVTGTTIGVRAGDRRTGAVKTFEYRPLHNNKRVNLIVTISGWMTGKIDDVRLPYSTVDPIMGDIYSVHWEPEMLQSMGQTINILATEALTQGLQQILGSTILVALMSALQLPIVLTKLAYLIDNPWTVSMARADLAGLILADSIIDRNLGSRPITLVGFSLGARVIFACLRELAKRKQYGLVQNVYMFGTPVVNSKDEYIRLRSVVVGRFVNGYATNDWILGYLFRATGGGVMRVAGLAPVNISGVENVNCTEWVPGHMSYRQAMPRLLREVGWTVESDEFTEIEDPDPENHEKRQRELINEIEEARKKLAEKPDKKRFNFFRRKKVEKKEWETYDESSQRHDEPNGDQDPNAQSSGVLFDIDAIKAEIAEFAAEDIPIKQLESTLPPIKLTLDDNAPSLRPTKSFNDSVASSVPQRGSIPLTTSTSAQGACRSHDTKELEEDIGMTMTFEVPEPKAMREEENRWPDPLPERPPLRFATTMPAVGNPEHNAWADDEEFVHGQEVKMTFE
ncbi:DUF726-domain-containing protein [Trichodelitschia bisporula]|uniref:DUF726-domain-containing protein n=1 Tax=Trichodelitschia bisporula TaxID=703511 RepID=A0A6G1HNI1_9PEZI|nr:DUF726-domain-containing protein [Trichodelitschia bisporula]